MIMILYDMIWYMIYDDDMMMIWCLYTTQCVSIWVCLRLAYHQNLPVLCWEAMVKYWSSGSRFSSKSIAIYFETQFECINFPFPLIERLTMPFNISVNGRDPQSFTIQKLYRDIYWINYTIFTHTYKAKGCNCLFLNWPASICLNLDLNIPQT